MQFRSGSMAFVMDYGVNFLCGFLGALHPFKGWTEYHPGLKHYFSNFLVIFFLAKSRVFL